MPFRQADATVQIGLDVTRYRVFDEEGVVEVWGYVGDYEVCVLLPRTDGRIRPRSGRAVPGAVTGGENGREGSD